MPGSADRSRRMRSSDTPSVPHGTKCRTALRSPYGPGWSSALWAVAIRQSTSDGSPMRPSAMEKPRSVSVPRQSSAARRMRSSSPSLRSRTRRTRVS